jgi:hypothetical protein
MNKSNEKTESLELNLAEFERDILEALIIESCEKNISVNEVIVNVLKTFLDKHETSNI